MARQIVNLEKLAEAQQAADAALEAATIPKPPPPRPPKPPPPPPCSQQPSRIGPVQFEAWGGMVAARCPSEIDPLMRKAGLSLDAPP